MGLAVNDPVLAFQPELGAQKGICHHEGDIRKCTGENQRHARGIVTALTEGLEATLRGRRPSIDDIRTSRRYGLRRSSRSAPIASRKSSSWLTTTRAPS